MCNQLLAESKDLHVLAYYAQALTAKHGLVGFCAGCEAIRANIDLYWESIYPKLEDEDGEFDPFTGSMLLAPLLHLMALSKRFFHLNY